MANRLPRCWPISLYAVNGYEKGLTALGGTPILKLEEALATPATGLVEA